MAGVYVPRSPPTSVLYGIVRAYLAGFLAAVAAESDQPPGFVVREFRKFLRCGVLAHGFARVRGGDCAFERLVPFCTGRSRPTCWPARSVADAWWCWRQSRIQR